MTIRQSSSPSAVTGLPAGGEPGELLVNTAPGEGDWVAVDVGTGLVSPIEYLGTYRPSISRGQWPTKEIVWDGQAPDSATRNQTSATYALRSTMYLASDEVSLTYVNGTVDGNGESIVNFSTIFLDDITVKVTVRKNGAGSYFPVTWGGDPDVVIAPGDQVESDTITGLTVEQDDYLIVYTYVQGASAGLWPATRAMSLNTSTGEGWVEGDDATDGVGIQSAVPGRGGGPYGYGPSIIRGASPDRRRCVAIIGDSIATNPASTAYITSALEQAQIPYVQCAISGDSWWTYGDGDWDMRLRLINGVCSDALCELGSNDIADGLPVATQQARAIAMWNGLRDAGCQRVYQTTVTPRDAGASTPGPTNSIRVAFNNWLRDGAPMVNGVAVAAGTSGADRAGSGTHPLTDYIEITDLIETARDSGLWNPSYRADGVHPNSTADDTVMQAGIVNRASLFGGANAVADTGPPQKHGTSAVYAPRFSSRSSGTAASWTNPDWSIGFPIEPDETFTIDALVLTILTGGSGGTVRLGIYDSNAAGWANNRLAYTSSNIDATAIAVHTKTLATAYEVQAGYRYWLMGFLAGSPVTGPTMLRGAGDCIEAPMREFSFVVASTNAGVTYENTVPHGAILDAPNPPIRLGAPANSQPAVPLIGYRVSS